MPLMMVLVLAVAAAATTLVVAKSAVVGRLATLRFPMPSVVTPLTALVPQVPSAPAVGRWWVTRRAVW